MNVHFERKLKISKGLFRVGGPLSRCWPSGHAAANATLNLLFCILNPPGLYNPAVPSGVAQGAHYPLEWVMTGIIIIMLQLSFSDSDCSVVATTTGSLSEYHDPLEWIITGIMMIICSLQVIACV